jgi:hypothetical protein
VVETAAAAAAAAAAVVVRGASVAMDSLSDAMRQGAISWAGEDSGVENQLEREIPWCFENALDLAVYRDSLRYPGRAG